MPRPPLEFRSLTTVYLGGQSPGSWLILSPGTKFLKVDFQRSALPTFAIYSFSGVRPCKSKMFQSTIWFTSLGWWLIALKGKRRLSFALLIQGRSRAAEERSCACSFLGLPRSCSRAPAPCLFSSVRLRPLRFEHRSCFAPPPRDVSPARGRALPLEEARRTPRRDGPAGTISSLIPPASSADAAGTIPCGLAAANSKETGRTVHRVSRQLLTSIR